ncbi:MAG: hypothetical protein KAQ92_01270, partial [Candidatus Aenigmarchaeota archaeon]|nr:hypothetical protein [Candidatus Aenigmarchaeota archaeon]
MNNESVKSINELLKELKEAVEEIKNIDAKDLIMDVRGPQLEGIETSLGHIEGLLKKETKSHEIESCLAELGDICLDVGGIAEGVRRKWKGAIQDKGKSDEERSAKLLENFFGKFKKVRDYVGDIEDNKFKGDYVGEGQLAEIYGYALDKNYLFSLDLEYKEYLKEDGEVKEEIKKAFEHKEIFFNKAIILKIKKYWIIEDGNKTYLINEDEDNKKLNIYAKTENTVEFVKKIATESKTKEKRIIDKKEYLLMLDFLKIFEKYYDKENIPAPQVYDYDETNKTIIMEKINGIVWMDIDKEKLIKNLPLVEELGRIIAIMHNHNYIHADFHDENVMLSSQNKWKIIDFEKSLYFLDERINLNILNLEKTYLSDSADILFKRRKLVS